jgi:hypothetical protein
MTRRSRLLVPGLLVVLLLVMAARIVATYDEFNATFDEGVHIATGIELYQLHQYSVDLEHPPLARWALGLLPFLNGVRTAEGLRYFAQGKHVLEKSGDYWQTLTAGRLGNLVFVPVLVFFVFRWAADLYGRIAGVAATAIVTCSPNILAHASLATLDLAATATLVGAAYRLYLYVRRPDRRNLVWAALLTGCAVACKYSAIGFLGLIAIGFLLFVYGRRLRDPQYRNASHLRAVMGRAVVFAAIVFVVVWASFGFEVRPFPEPARRPPPAIDAVLPYGLPVPAMGLWEGLVRTALHARKGHSDQFLLGEVRRYEGWWYYFPVALSVKSTLPFLLLLVLAAGLLWSRRAEAWRDGSCYPALAALLVLAPAMASGLNIGVRHILPVYALLAVLAASLFTREGGAFRQRPAVLGLAFALLGGHAVASAMAHPDYLAYFNEFGRGREHRILSDSNLDWGQDLARLGRYMQEHGIDEVHLSYFGSTSPRAVGIENARPIVWGERPTGWVAISVAKLQGLYLGPWESNYLWLLKQTPRAQIGKSIWLYCLDC